MKNVKLILMIAGMVGTHLLYAQEFKLSVNGVKTIKFIEINNAEIEGYDGNELVISTEVKNKKDEKRAEGLTAISGMGLKDNSGIGLSVVEKGNDIEIQQLGKRNSNKYKFKVPKNCKVFYQHSNTMGGKTISIKNISAEIEASVLHSNIYLENVTGPMTINSVHGKIEAIFAAVNQESPISIINIHGLVDVTLPTNTKANLKLASHWGELLTDMNIEFDKSDEELRSHSSKVTGKLNGGGVAIHLSSTHNNVYLRNKK